MRRRHRVHVVSLAIGRSTPVVGMAIPRSIAGGLFDDRSDGWLNWRWLGRRQLSRRQLSRIGCVNSFPGTTSEQEGATTEKDREDKMSMIHAAFADCVINPRRRVLQVCFSLNQRNG